MTDEEMAEEYCNHLQSEMLAYTPENPRRQRTVTLLDVEDAFIAGLKAGRPQWHDLRKDPTDLPKENVKVHLYARDKEYYIGFWENGAWKYESGFYASDNFVIAWCEIPTFDKE